MPDTHESDDGLDFRADLEITSEQLRQLSKDSVRFYLALDRDAAQIAMTYGVSVAKVEKIVAALERDKAEEKERAEALRVIQERALKGRPFPPAELIGGAYDQFRPSPELLDWVKVTFLAEGGPLFNPKHRHLRFAHLAFLWTNAANSKQGRMVAGTAEMPSIQGGKWVRARMEFQLTQWFGAVPTFLITLDAGYAARCDNASFCGLVEHELCHCAQAWDPLTGPKYNKDGMPVFCIKGHDVEQFVDVVARYGAKAAGVSDMVEAAKRGPTIAAAKIDFACGACR